MKKERIVLEGGKYVFERDENWHLTCSRFGAPWRDFLGDKAVHALFSKAIELQGAHKNLAQEVCPGYPNPDFQVGDRVRVECGDGTTLVGTVSFTTQDFVEVEPDNEEYVRGPFPNKACTKLLF